MRLIVSGAVTERVHIELRSKIKFEQKRSRQSAEVSREQREGGKGGRKKKMLT